MVKVNGTPVDAAGRTLGDYLREAGYPRARIAVERNGEIVPKADYETVCLEEGDCIEVVSFVGGG